MANDFAATLKQAMKDWDSATEDQRHNALRIASDLAASVRVSAPAPKTKIQVTPSEAVKIAEKCEDAYSFDRYASWSAVAKMLARRGLNAREIEAIMRSKWTRWAADISNNRYGHVTAKDLARFIDNDRGVNQAEIDQLVRETFDCEVA